jgi:hypothetical protein
MKSTFARVLTASGLLLLAGASTACVDEARCDAALAGVAGVRSEAARRETQRDAQIAWLRWWQTSMAVQLQSVAANAGNDALKRQLAALEAENAMLAQRLERAERRIEEARAPASSVEHGLAAQPPVAPRRLDPVVPYDLTGFLSRPPSSGKREAHGATGAASRPLERRDPVPAGQRTLDETVPYE